MAKMQNCRESAECHACSSMGACLFMSSTAAIICECWLLICGFCPGFCGDCSGAVLCARYCITILALSVLPAPLSPLMRIACFCSSIIMALNACRQEMQDHFSAFENARLHWKRHSGRTGKHF